MSPRAAPRFDQRLGLDARDGQRLAPGMAYNDPLEANRVAASSPELGEFRRRLSLRLTCGVLLTLGVTSCENTTTSSADNGYDTVECFNWPQAASGGAAGGGGTSTTGGAGNGGAGGATGGMGGAAPASCPAGNDALQYMTGDASYCGGNVKSTAPSEAGQCCYNVTVSSCVAGRPFLVEGAARMAPLRLLPWGAPAERSDDTWSGRRDGSLPRPDVAELTLQERHHLAEAWVRDALLEHASIASFGRFALELAALGAPPSLLRKAHEAALDEVKHAQLAFSLASTYAGADLGPGAFPFGGSVEVSQDAAEIAVRVVREGCFGETLASVVAAEQAARATDPAVREALSIIAEDEAKHAELAWVSVAWMLRAGGDSVRRAVALAITETFARPPVELATSVPSTSRLEGHGRPPASVLAEAMERALSEVIRPAAAALLTSSGAPLTASSVA